MQDPVLTGWLLLLLLQCHYDTYGHNFVAQVEGSKAWTLFPPSATPALYPTRVPYEESSVFSRVCVTKPDLVAHPRFRGINGYRVVLKVEMCVGILPVLTCSHALHHLDYLVCVCECAAW